MSCSGDVVLRRPNRECCFPGGPFGVRDQEGRESLTVPDVMDVRFNRNLDQLMCVADKSDGGLLILDRSRTC